MRYGGDHCNRAALKGYLKSGSVLNPLNDSPWILLEFPNPYLIHGCILRLM